MTDVVITIGADASAASAAVGGFGGSVASEFALIGQQIDRTLGQFSQLGDQVSSALGGTVSSFGDFDQSMKNVESIAVGTTEQFAAMEQQAKELASQMPTTSTAIAEGFFSLASAGLDANEIMAVTPSIMDLAAASATDFDTAASGVTAAIFSYGLEIEDANQVTEIFQNTNTQFKTTMPELADSLKFAGSAAASVGVDFQTTAAAIGFARNAGLGASQAGSGLRTTMLALAAPTDAAREKMEELGIAIVTDSEGNLDLQASLESVEDGLGTLSGTTERAAALEAIFTKEGLAVTKALLDNVDAIDSTAASLTEQGAVAAAVKIQNEGLNNQMAILNGSIEEQQNLLGEKLAPAELKTIEIKLKMLETVNKLPAPFVEWGGGILLVTSNMAKMIFPVIQAVIQLGLLFATMGASSGATIGATVSTAAHTVATNIYTVAQGAANIALALFPAFLVVAAIAALIIGIILLVQNWDTVTAVMADLWEFIAGAFIAAWVGLISLFSTVKDTLTEHMDIVLAVMAVLFPFVGIPLLIIANWDTLVGFFGAFFETMTSFFGDFFTNIVPDVIGKIGELVAGIVSRITEAPASILGALGGIKDTILGFFTGLAADALGWGIDLVTNFADGLIGGIPVVGPAASGVISSVGGFLGFDIPSNDAMAARWGFDLGSHFAAGLADSSAAVSESASQVIGEVAATPIGAAGAGGGRGGDVNVTLGRGAIQVNGPATRRDGNNVGVGLREELIRIGAFSQRTGA